MIFEIMGKSPEGGRRDPVPWSAVQVRFAQRRKSHPSIWGGRAQHLHHQKICKIGSLTHGRISLQLGPRYSHVVKVDLPTRYRGLARVEPALARLAMVFWSLIAPGNRNKQGMYRGTFWLNRSVTSNTMDILLAVAKLTPSSAPLGPLQHCAASL